MTGRSPQRTCIACRTKRAKNELLRVTRTPAGDVELDLEQAKPGRGAYVCRDEACVTRALTARAFTRHLGATLSDDFRERLIARFHA